MYISSNELEKSNLLTATVWILADEGKNNIDIEQIEVCYNQFKGGDLPLMMFMFYLKKMYQILKFISGMIRKKEIKVYWYNCKID